MNTCVTPVSAAQAELWDLPPALRGHSRLQGQRQRSPDLLTPTGCLTPGLCRTSVLLYEDILLADAVLPRQRFYVLHQAVSHRPGPSWTRRWRIYQKLPHSDETAEKPDSQKSLMVASSSEAVSGLIITTAYSS